MKVLVIGGGGREHAIVHTLKKSPKVDHIWCAPGNGGIARDAVCVPEIGAKDIGAIVGFARAHAIDFAVVAPDDPLCLGLVDLLREKGVDLKDHPALQVREYIYDMAPVMRAADLVICRAGASTISELTALGVPALIVPSPYVTNNHQEKNARILEQHGGAVVLLEADASGEALYRAASGILRDPERQADMSRGMAELGIPDATERIYRTVMALRK